MSYDLREKISHIGYCSNQIVATNNLPTIKQVLAVLFYNLRRYSTSVRESAQLTIEECFIIWKKARIPTQEYKKCVTKLEAEYERWRKIQKNASRRSDTQIKNEQAYVESINKLFDIAIADALNKMTNESDKQFLLVQRSDSASLVGTLSSSTSTTTSETSPMEVDCENVSSKMHQISTTIDQDKAVNITSELLEDDSLKKATKEELHEILGPESESPLFENTPPTKRRATEAVITPKLAAALDKCRVSKRDVMHLLMAAAEAFGIDTRDLVMNVTSIHEARQKYRKERYQAIKKLAPSLFSGLPSTIHWDGKILPGYLRRETSERVAIIVTSSGMEQILAVPKIASSSGLNQAEAVFNTLNDWSLSQNIVALCCDSTASNTGRLNGACVILERLMDKNLFYFICRHHIYELILRCAFETKFGKTTGPDVQLFKNFGDSWKSIDQGIYEPGISDRFVNESLQDEKGEILDFCSKYLEEDLAKSEYREFLELVIIFLGGKLPTDKVFHPPGAIHHARWMAKAIYCLKIFIFRKQYLLEEEDIEIKCRDVCIFIVKVYVRAWFCTPLAAQAPNQDLKFFKCLHEYSRIDKSISECAVEKFLNHFWYLTPQMAALSFFDPTISNEEKMKMCKSLGSDSTAFFYGKRILASKKDLNELVNSSIGDFISKDSNAFFESFGIETTFLKKNPSTWAKERNYIHGVEVVRNLKVVNDTAERGVKLMTEFNNILTKDEAQSQYLLPILKDYRSMFPDSKKETLMQSYE